MIARHDINIIYLYMQHREKEGGRKMRARDGTQHRSLSQIDSPFHKELQTAAP